MWHSVTSSRRLAAAAVLGVLLFGAGAVPPAAARVFLSVDEALELAFPGCSVERDNAFLTEAQVARASELAGEEVESALAYPYRATCDGEPAGTAYFDTHRVRTLPETLMVVVDPEGEVERIEILSFKEPPEYIPREIWYDQFTGRELDPELQLKRGIRHVTGATLTAQATTSAVRRVLAIHRVLQRAGTGSPENDGEGK
jgi:hypothetical protein